MPRLFSLIAAGSLLVPTAALPQTPSPVQVPAPATEAAPPLPGIDRASQTEDVRFRTDFNQRMTVGVMVGGVGPYRFVVDTGADRTVVSSELAARMKLAPAGSAPLHSVAGVAPVATATVPTLQVTRKVVRNVVAPVLAGTNIGADGILGVDALRSQRIDLDFARQTMSVVPSQPNARGEDPNAIVVEGHRRNGRLVITEASIHGVQVTVVLDTGSEVTIGNDALRTALFRKQTNLFHPVVLKAVTGQTLVGQGAMVDQFEIGGAGLSNLEIVFATAHIFDQLQLNRRPALLLGMDAMRAFKKVSIDFAAQKLRVVVPEHSALDIRLASRL